MTIEGDFTSLCRQLFVFTQKSSTRMQAVFVSRALPSSLLWWLSTGTQDTQMVLQGPKSRDSSCTGANLLAFIVPSFCCHSLRPPHTITCQNTTHQKCPMLPLFASNLFQFLEPEKSLEAKTFQWVLPFPLAYSLVIYYRRNGWRD